ncbi:MAG: hypothetical protein IKD35_01735, partial [Clostridia bacterium]|nr:hypothetical protein [Clostridia bacterium]
MGNFWEELKDAFKTKSERDEERSESLKNALEQEQDIVDQLEELEKEYQAYLESQEEEIDLDALFPPTLGLQKIEYTPESDESIVNRATTEVESKKADATDKAESKYSSKISGVKEEKDTATIEKLEKDKEIDTAYEKKRQNQKKDSVKRGMARGSVLESLIDEITADQTRTEQEVEDAYMSTIDSLNKEMDALTLERERAMSELDLKYASELKDKIAELKEDRDAIVAKYTKYNNNVDEKELKYQQQRQKDIDKFLEDKKKEKEQEAEKQREYEKEHGYSGEKLRNYSERYVLAFNFYMSLEP